MKDNQAVKTKLFFKLDLDTSLKDVHFEMYTYSDDAAKWDDKINITEKETKKKVNDNLGMAFSRTSIDIKLPRQLKEITLYNLITKMPAGNYIPRHKDATRLCSFYSPVWPTENYSPLYFDDIVIPNKNDGAIWLINHQESHWVDNSNGPDRYNLQVTFSKPYHEVKQILNDLRLI